MMTKRTKFSIFEGMIFLILIAAMAVVYLNWSYAHAAADKAQITVLDYAVGTEYTGVITQQYVAVGDTVSPGQLLFKLRSDDLSAKLAAGTIKPENLLYKLSDQNELLITAGKAGRVQRVDFPQGSFVPGDKQIALISDTTTLGVNAQYTLPRADLGRLTPATQVMVELPSHRLVTAQVVQVTHTSENGRDVTNVQARLAQVPASDITVSAGASVHATAILTASTYYSRLVAWTGTLVNRWQ